jgi:hypothetical protein
LSDLNLSLGRIAASPVGGELSRSDDPFRTCPSCMQVCILLGCFLACTGAPCYGSRAHGDSMNSIRPPG